MPHHKKVNSVYLGAVLLHPETSSLSLMSRYAAATLCPVGTDRPTGGHFLLRLRQKSPQLSPAAHSPPPASEERACVCVTTDVDGKPQAGKTRQPAAS